MVGMAGHGWPWLDMASHSLPWLAMACHGWTWLAVSTAASANCGRPWLALALPGRPWPAQKLERLLKQQYVNKPMEAMDVLETPVDDQVFLELLHGMKLAIASSLKCWSELLWKVDGSIIALQSQFRGFVVRCKFHVVGLSGKTSNVPTPCELVEAVQIVAKTVSSPMVANDEDPETGVLTNACEAKDWCGANSAECVLRYACNNCCNYGVEFRDNSVGIIYCSCHKAKTMSANPCRKKKKKKNNKHNK